MGCQCTAFYRERLIENEKFAGLIDHSHALEKSQRNPPRDWTSRDDHEIGSLWRKSSRWGDGNHLLFLWDVALVWAVSPRAERLDLQMQLATMMRCWPGQCRMAAARKIAVFLSASRF